MSVIPSRLLAPARPALLAIVALLAVALAACGSPPSLDEVEPVSGVTEVAVRDSYYEPRVIEIPAGTEVTWRWEGRRDHDVVANDFRSDLKAAESSRTPSMRRASTTTCAGCTRG